MQNRCNTFNIISLAREREINVEIAMIPVRLATLSFAKKTMSSFENAGVYLFFSENHVTFTGPHRKSRFFLDQVINS